MPQLIVEAAFTSASPVPQPGALLLDDASAGKLDTGTLADYTQWTDITSPWTQDLTITRASTREQGPVITYEGGTLAATLDNSDARFAPENLSGPYVTPGVPAMRFGAFLDQPAYNSSTGWTGALANWNAITGIPLNAARWYLGASSFTWGGSLAALAAAGTRICITLKPAYNPVSATDLAAMTAFLQAAKAAGADMRVTLWHEPNISSGLTAAQFQAMWAYYGPTVRQYYPLYAVLTSTETNPANGYYPPQGSLDGLAADDYALGISDLQAVAAQADIYGVPVGLWEFNSSFDLGIDPSPVSGVTAAQNAGYLQQVQAFFQQRIGAGKPVGDVLLFTGGTGGSTGTGNFLLTSLTQNGGFEGGLGNWIPHTNATIAQTSAQAHSGTGSVAITAIAAGTTSASMCGTGSLATQALAVTAGTQVAASAWVKAATTGRNFQAGVVWRDAAGTLLGANYGTGQTDVTTGWTLLTAVATAPASAAYAILDVQGTSLGAGEVHYADDPQIATLPASIDHTAPVQYPWDWRIPYLAAMQQALDGQGAIPAVTRVTPMVPVRARATWAGVTYPLFRGFAQAWTPQAYQGPGFAQTVLTAADGFMILAGVTIPALQVPVGAGELSGARVTRILTAAGWYSAARGLSVISAGSSALQATSLGAAALDLLRLTAASEIGDLYVDASGRLTFRGRRDIITDTRGSTVQAVFGDMPGTVHPAGTELYYSAVTRPAADLSLANDVQATRVGGTMQEATDAASVARFLFPRTYARSDLILQDDTSALNWAHYVLYITSAGNPEFDSITLIPAADPANLWPQALGREIGDRIQVWSRPPGMAGAPIVRDCLIRGITHVIGAGTWETTFSLQDASRYSFLTLDSPALGQLGHAALTF